MVKDRGVSSPADPHRRWCRDAATRSRANAPSGGENTPSLEVEECLFRHPKIMEEAVVAWPDEHWGETVCAFVPPRAPLLY